MRNTGKQVVIFVGILATFFFPLHMAQADATTEMGCIVREQGTAKYLRSDLIDKNAIKEAALNAKSQGAKVLDPCLSGQLRNLPAAVYSALAQQHPEKFQPLETGNNSVAPLNQAASSKASGNGIQYHYVGLDSAVPPGFLGFFSPSAINNSGRVYGNTFTESDGVLTPYVATFDNGTVSVSQQGIANTANESGTVGGFVLTDLENFLGQAALFRGNEVQLIPRLPGEIHSEVLQLNEPGTALLMSFDENFNLTLALYDGRQVTPLNFGPQISFAFFLSMNNQGIISGTTSIEGVGDRGFRFDPNASEATLLNPLPTEPDSWALGINNHGDVLGYSFIASGTERIGVWDAKGKFQTYFVEGTSEFPTISNDLKFNDNNLIVITRVSSPVNEVGNSYLVPKPGVRLNLADLVQDMPSEQGSLWWVRGVNNLENMFGFTLTPDFSSFDFLLERKNARN